MRIQVFLRSDKHPNLIIRKIIYYYPHCIETIFLMIKLGCLSERKKTCMRIDTIRNSTFRKVAKKQFHI